MDIGGLGPSRWNTTTQRGGSPVQQTKNPAVISFAVGWLVALLAGPGGMWALEDMSAIAQKTPAVHVSGALLGLLTLVPLGLGTVAGSTLLLINRPDLATQFRKRIGDKIFLATAGCFLLAIVILPFATRFILPTYGYSICNGLKDSTSRFGNDWVHNPAWCLPNKTMADVNAMFTQKGGDGVGAGADSMTTPE